MRRPARFGVALGLPSFLESFLESFLILLSEGKTHALAQSDLTQMHPIGTGISSSSLLALDVRLPSLFSLRGRGIHLLLGGSRAGGGRGGRTADIDSVTHRAPDPPRAPDFDRQSPTATASLVSGLAIIIRLGRFMEV